ncbi:MAG TPA: hypothetical protein VHE81_08110, partial [Lacipirellulaceae bacterium]|nr:hypothetical protein [Lacipirellulaceae bacterium]
MRTIWQSLAWKEWNEHKWKVVSLLAVLLGVAVLIRVTIERDDDVLDAWQVLLDLCVAPLAIFIGLGTAAGERSRGTLAFLQALPVPMRRVAVHKWFYGLATILAAAGVTIALLYVWAALGFMHGIQHYWRSQLQFSFGIHNWFANATLVVFYTAASFYIWAVAWGVNRKDEVSAVAVALLIMVVWTVAVSYGIHFLFRGSAPALAVGLSTVPGGLLKAVETLTVEVQRPEFIGLAVASAVVVHVALSARFVRRFGRTANLDVRSPNAANAPADEIDWLGPPRGSM